MLLRQIYKNYCQNAKCERWNLEAFFSRMDTEKSIEADMKLRTINIKKESTETRKY